MPSPRSAVAAVRPSLLLGLLFIGGCTSPALIHPPSPLPVTPSPVAAPPAPYIVRPASPPPSPAPNAPSPVDELSGGGQLLVESDPLAGSVAVALFVRAGAADEPTPGLRHLLERTLLDRGLVAGARAAELRSRGSEVVSFTGPDYTAYQVVLPRLFWRSGLDLLRQLLDEPSGSMAEALERQRQAIGDERVAAEPDGAALRRLLAAIDPAHPYQWPLLGTPGSLAGLQDAELRAFFRQYYSPDRLTWVVVGDVERSEVAAQLAVRLATLPLREKARSPAVPRGPAPARAGPQLSLQPRPSTAGPPELLLGFAIPPAATVDLPALELATALLAADGESGGSAASGELASEGRRSLLLSGRESGALVLRPLGRPTDSIQSLDEAVVTTLSAALRLGQREVAVRELERVQRQLLAAATLRSETPAGRAQRLGSFALLGIDEAAYEARLRGLTPAGLRESLGRYFRLENLTLSIAAPARLLDPQRLQAAVASASPRPVASPPPLPSTPGAVAAQLYRLRSGAQLVLLPDPRQKTVALAALWSGGTRLEDERSAGLHQLLVRAWPRAGRTRRGEPLIAELRELAATLEPHLGPDSFGLRAQLLSADLGPGLALLRDCLEQPTLAESEVERGRRELLIQLGGRHGGAQQLESEAAQSAWRLFTRSLLGGHPYALQPTPQSVTALTRRRLLEFFRQHYSRERLVLAVVGDFALPTLLAELEPWLGPLLPATGGERPLRQRPAGPDLPSLRSPAAASQSFQLGPAQQAHLIVGFPAPGARRLGGGPPSTAPPVGEVGRPAVEVLAELLLDGRLERALTSRRSLASAVSVQLSSGLEPGYLAFYLATAPGRLEAAEATLRDELHRLIDHPVTAEELSTARERLLGRRALRGQHRRDRALQLAQAVALALPDRALAEAGRRPDEDAELLAVDPAAVQAAALRLLREDQMVRVAVLPQSLVGTGPAPTPSASPPPSLMAQRRLGQGKLRLLASRQPMALPSRGGKHPSKRRPAAERKSGSHSESHRGR